MTREEAISIMKVIVHMLEEKYDTDRVEEAVDMSIKALSAEPCEDCISRQAVNILVDELARAISDERCCMPRGRSTASIMQDILDLPSVQPKPKTGHWIDSHCDCCGKVASFHIGRCGGNAYTEMYYSNYCPNCGAKMESEG